MKLWQGIVKVQIPIYTNEPEPKCLVYSSGRKKINFQLPITKDLRITMGDEKKKYFVAHLNAKNQLIIEKEIDGIDF